MSSRDSQPHPNADVRMRGFAERATVEQALAWLDAQLSALPAEEVSLWEAAGRVLAEEVRSTRDVPDFARAMMDGYAVHAADTQGASAYNRLPLRAIGECLPGEHFDGAIPRGCAVRIMTGAPLPSQADAVLPAELVELNRPATDPPSAPKHAQASSTEEAIWAVGEVSPQKHVGAAGEDIACGAKVFSAGRRLRPQDVGVLSLLGRAKVAVVGRPRVHLIVTGNELLPAGAEPTGSKIPDANGPMLAALVVRDGGVLMLSGPVRDERDAIWRALSREADLVLVSGGSSVGQEDHVPTLLAERGELAIHGVAMRPSSPAGMGKLDDRLVFLLPGNPVSCLCAYDFFASRAIRALSGLDGGRRSAGRAEFAYRTQRARLARKLVSQVGRVDYARVRWQDDRLEPLAISGASILSSTTRADGFVVVPADSEGYPAGAEVEVHLYD